MAKAAKKAEPAKKVNPFKTKKTKQPTTKIADSVTPPDNVAAAIDKFREAQEQAKYYEGEATLHKNEAIEFCEQEYAQRLQSGVNGSFKVMGDETMITYTIMDSSAGLTEEDVSSFTEKWGEDAADHLITRDFASIRFDAKVLEANYDAVVDALQVLPPDVLENLFKPMLMKAKSGAAEESRRYAKSPEELREIIKDLKIKNYIK